jgi:uncharacterized membrane protein (DUF4010 family)
MFLRVIVLVAVVNRKLLPEILIPFLLMGLTSGGYAAFLYFGDSSVDGTAPNGEVEIENPFSLTAAAKFAALFAVVLLAVKIVQEHFPPSGLYAVAALAGAITLSMSEFAQSGDARVAVIAIVIASLSNTIVKCGMGFLLGGEGLGKKLSPATAATLAAGLAAALLL